MEDKSPVCLNTVFLKSLCTRYLQEEKVLYRNTVAHPNNVFNATDSIKDLWQ
jgi:hypothetical protein